MAADDIHWQPIAAAAATLSDSAAPERSGIVASTSHPASTSGGSPSRSAPRQSVAAPRSVSNPRPPWATRAARGAGVSPNSARSGGRPKIEPMLARTAFGEKGSAQPGPSTTGPPRRASAVRRMVPTLPGSPTPCR